jgi:hypothetical protein
MVKHHKLLPLTFARVTIVVKLTIRRREVWASSETDWPCPSDATFRLARSRCQLAPNRPMQDTGQRISETDDTDAGRGQWLSVPELAAKRRISEQSAARLVRRRRWQRRTDADGVVRIRVPDVTADTPNRPRGSQPAIEVLRMAVESLTERLRISGASGSARTRRTRTRQVEARVQVLEVEVGAKLQAAQERADRAEGVRDAALEATNRADAQAAAARGRLADMERDSDARERARLELPHYGKAKWEHGPA